MILNREDLKLYLAEDKRVNVKCYGESPFLKHWIAILMDREYIVI